MLRVSASLPGRFCALVRGFPLATRPWTLQLPTPVAAASCGRWRYQHTAAPPTDHMGGGGGRSRAEEGSPLVSTAGVPKMRSRKFIMRSFYDLLPALEQGGTDVEQRLLAFMNLCHGSTVVETPGVKVQMAEEMWQALQDKGVRPGSHIYNIMLRVYNANNHAFKPSDLLEKMQADCVFPNQGTFTLLIAAYCNQGNVSGATKLLEYMKSLDFPMSEGIYASLVTGHARAGNMEAAERVITNMKDTHQKPHNPTYTSLLCAYAEKGDVESIEKVFADMKVENVFPSMVTYIRVMNSLSQFGHGSLVGRVLDLVKNREWLSADLRLLIIMCLCRGEVEAPRILIEELSKNEGLSKMVVGMYLAKCLEQGQSAKELLDHIGTLDNTDSVPVYDSVISRMLFEHPPVVKGAKFQNQTPAPGALAPHPQGVLWAKNLLEVYDHMPSDKQGSWHYYPLLARHCSDVNVDGLVACVQQMVAKNVIIDRHVRRYINTVMKSAGTTMEDYMNTKLNELDESNSEDLQFPLFCLLYNCSDGNFKAALSLVNRFKESVLLKEHNPGIVTAIRGGYLVRKGHNEDLVLLFKSLFRLPHPPRLSECLDACCMIHVERKMHLARVLDFLSALELSKVDVATSRNYLFVMSHLTREDRGIFRAAYAKLKSQAHLLKPDNYATIFKAAVKTGCYGISRTVYDKISPEMAKRLDVRNAYLLYLSQFRHSVLDAVELLDTMLAEGQTPSLLCWFRVIPEVLKADLVKGGEFIEKMITCGYQPNSTQRHKFLEVCVQQGCIKEAKEQFSIIKSEGWSSVEAYYLMAKLWAESGQVEETEALLKEAKSEDCFSQETFLPVLVQMQLKSGNYEGACKELSAVKPTAGMYPVLSNMLVQCIKENQPLDPIMDYMKESSLSSTTTNSLVFFACVDAQDEERAAAVLQEIDMLDRRIFDQFTRKPEGEKYLRVLKANKFYLKNIKCAYLMKSGYVMLNDEEGLQHLVQELKQTDWLWKQL